jgi:hypothetical protein
LVPYLSIRAKRWRMASETDIHRRLYLRHAKMVFTVEEQTTHAIQLDMSLAPFSFATCCCVEKRQNFTECFLLFNHSRHCHGGGSSVNLITDFSTFRGGANCHAACKLAGEILYVLAWSQPEKPTRCSSELSVLWPPRRRNLRLACG